jgi:hypothetical protein
MFQYMGKIFWEVSMFAKKSVCRFSILLVLMAILMLTSTAYTTPPLLVNSARAASITPAMAQTSLLQYVIDGHVLGFASDKVYLAGLDHALTVEFSGGQRIAPVGTNTSITSKIRGTPTLGSVTYQDVWHGVDII